MRDLQPIGRQFFRQRNHLRQAVEILTVHHQVHGEGEALALDQVRQLDLEGMRPRAGDLVGRGFLRVLET